MSLDKAIEHGKENRKPYRGAKAVDRTCCNHGSDKWAESNRTYHNQKKEEATLDELKLYEGITIYVHGKSDVGKGEG